MGTEKDLSRKEWMLMQEIAAGGVVFRQNKEQIQFLLIADRFGRWTLPKGKKEVGETEEETALREIEEETGIKGEIISFLQKTTYTYTHPEKGLISKEVHYFLVKAIGGECKPQLTEIAGVKWFSAEEAWKQQQEKGYENNREVLVQAFQALKVNK